MHLIGHRKPCFQRIMGCCSLPDSTAHCDENAFIFVPLWYNLQAAVNFNVIRKCLNDVLHVCTSLSMTKVLFVIGLSIVLQIMDELNKNSVEIYRFPTDDETVADINNQMNVSYYSFIINL